MSDFRPLWGGRGAGQLLFGQCQKNCTIGAGGHPLGCRCGSPEQFPLNAIF